MISISKHVNKCVVAGAFLGFSPSGWGDEDVLRKLAQAAPHLTVTDVSVSPVAGMHEIEIEEDRSHLYVTADGKYLVAGDLYAISSVGLVNVTEVRREARRRDVLGRLDVADMIVFSATGETRSVVYAFTDVNCRHCQRLHADVDKLNDYGIEVRYLAFPRGGPGTPAYDKMVSVWCAAQRQAAITAAKSNEAVADLACDSPVAEQLALGRSFHIGGTPTLFTERGRQLSGYLPPDELAQRLGLR